MALLDRDYARTPPPTLTAIATSDPASTPHPKRAGSGWRYYALTALLCVLLWGVLFAVTHTLLSPIGMLPIALVSAALAYLFTKP